MRCYQVFAQMSPEQAVRVLREIQEKAPAAFVQALGLAASALRARPVYLTRLPFEKRAEAVRRALSRVASNAVAEEILAVYFLECHRPLLVEWLDTVGLEHEEGVLKSDTPEAPEAAKLGEAVQRFLGAGDEAPTRTLLLYAFAAQEPVDWPELDRLLAEHPLPKSA